MLFSSPIFFLFFAIYFVLHCSVPRRFRIYLIIAGSAIFYAWWKINYVSLPFVLAAIAYSGARFMERAPSAVSRRRRMIITVVALFFPLLCFKYADFLYRDIIGVFF